LADRFLFLPLDRPFPICYTLDRIRGRRKHNVAGQYDDNVKKLIEANPQDFVTLTVNGGD
jgi:hypothetical protein